MTDLHVNDPSTEIAIQHCAVLIEHAVAELDDRLKGAKFEGNQRQNE